jgi:Tol biopolymer transport system component
MGGAQRWLGRSNATDRQPAYSPDGQKLLFTSNRSGNLDVWELSLVTGGVRRITLDPGLDQDPAYSPDGRSLYWSSSRSGHLECWTAAVDGSGGRQVTSDGVLAENPAPTPDGTSLVYAGPGGLWRARLDGSPREALVKGSVILPDVSPDGRHVLFQTTVGDHFAVRVARMADGEPVEFEIRVHPRRATPVDLGRARWMPDGRAIAFIGQDDEGRIGVFTQEFAPGRDTASSRRKLAGFDSDLAVESFAVAPDASRAVISLWEQVFSIVEAQVRCP